MTTSIADTLSNLSRDQLRAFCQRTGLTLWYGLLGYQI
jgi:hypothetical protein